MSRRSKTFDTLTEQQELFCKEYLKDLNGTQAAIRAGYSEKTAQEQSSRLLSHVIVKSRVQELFDKRSKKLDISAETVLAEILKLARVDLADAYDDSGKLLPIKQMPEDVRRAISSIETVSLYAGTESIGDTKKVRFYDKTKALELLGKHLKLFVDRVEHSGKLTLEEILEGTKTKE